MSVSERCGALYTPGHAVHHVAYHDAKAEYTVWGDVAGVRLREREPLSANAPTRPELRGLVSQHSAAAKPGPGGALSGALLQVC